MHTHNVDHWTHEHTSGQERISRGERRTLIVAILTAVTMTVEIAAGLAFGSMALLADGLHMASHATALGIAVLAYVYTRRFAGDGRYSFGTGRINALAGFASAILLALFAVAMTIESLQRLIQPIAIGFNSAISVALIGLLVNGVSLLILAVPHHSGGDRHHHNHRHHHQRHAGDLNLRGAYLHVLADSLTSLLAVFVLVMGKYFGAVWMDPAIGIVGALLIARWSTSLLRESAYVLLDRQAPDVVRTGLQRAIEANGNDRIADLHVWSLGPDIYAADIAVVSHDPRPPDHYKRLIPGELGVVHSTVEVHHCQPTT
jgi:cation diffusion facilitator family transporter